MTHDIASASRSMPAQSEAQIQSAIVEYIRVVAPQCLVFAIPNAARRSRGARASNAVAGLQPGIPDLCVLTPGGRAHFIEVKSAKGFPSQAQLSITWWMHKNDVPWCIARSIEDARAALLHWKIETREVIAA